MATELAKENKAQAERIEKLIFDNDAQRLEINILTAKRHSLDERITRMEYVIKTHEPANNTPAMKMAADLDEQVEKLLAEKKALTERIARMRRIDSETRDQAARDYAKVKSLTEENKAQAERIAVLERELLERGSHAIDCQVEWLAEDENPECTCGWDARKKELEQALKGEVES